MFDEILYTVYFGLLGQHILSINFYFNFKIILDNPKDFYQSLKQTWISVKLFVMQLDVRSV